MSLLSQLRSGREQMRKRLAPWDDLLVELKSSVEISRCYALRVTQQLRKLVDREPGFADKRAQSAWSEFFMERDGQNCRVIFLAHMQMTPAYPQPLPSCLLKSPCRLFPRNASRQTQQSSHLCLRFRFSPFLKPSLVGNFKPPFNGIPNVCQRFFFRPTLRNASWQCRTLSNEPTRFVLPQDNFQGRSDLVFSEIHVSSPATKFNTTRVHAEVIFHEPCGSVEVGA